jgi:hypothetical protein
MTLSLLASCEAEKQESTHIQEDAAESQEDVEIMPELPRPEEPTTAINVNDVALDLISLFHDGKIKESSKKGAFMDTMAGSLYEQFKEIGYGFRIKECSEKWRFFEDRKYRILIGSVYKNEHESSIFVPLPQNLWVELASERCVAARSS